VGEVSTLDFSVKGNRKNIHVQEWEGEGVCWEKRKESFRPGSNLEVGNEGEDGPLASGETSAW